MHEAKYRVKSELTATTSPLPSPLLLRQSARFGFPRTASRSPEVKAMTPNISRKGYIILPSTCSVLMEAPLGTLRVCSLSYSLRLIRSELLGSKQRASYWWGNGIIEYAQAINPSPLSIPQDHDSLPRSTSTTN
jgi:hypothetical protein